MKLEKILKYAIATIGAIYLAYETFQDYRLKEQREKVYQGDVPLFT